MDKKAYLWLFNNITRYYFNSPEACELRDAFIRVPITEESLEIPDVLQATEEYYTRFVELFYNNVYGYQNGLVSKPISSSELDCYFIETSEGFLPIGYYKVIRPAETVLIVQKYLEICADTINTEKNRIIIEWQKKINGVSQRYEDVKTSGNPSTVKATLGVVFTVLLLIISVISVVKMNLFGVMFGLVTPENAVAGVPIMANGDSWTWYGYLVFVLAGIFLMLVGALCTIREFLLLEEQKKTEELLSNISNYINTMEGGVNYVVANGTEMIQSAIRKGDNLFVTPNGNAVLILEVNKKINIAKEFTFKTNFQRSGIWYALIAFMFVFFTLLSVTHLPAMTDIFNDEALKQNIGDNISSDTSNTLNQPKVSSYIVKKDDVTWTQAQTSSQYEGGNIISINDYAEFEKACELAEQAGLQVCWVGARIDKGELWSNARSLDDTALYVPVWFSKNGVTEPTYVDSLGNDELYLMMFKVDGKWYYNDAANDAIAASKNMYKGKIGYIIEIEE